MAFVFLSYERKDSETARVVAQALEKAGHTVWWDRNIKGGAQFSKEIEQALERADAIVVLWSISSVESAWVRDEAAAGRDSGRLVPARIDATPPPLGFRQYQTIDLTGRKSSAGIWWTRFNMLMMNGNPGAAIALARDPRSRASGVTEESLERLVAVAAPMLSREPTTQLRWRRS